jgi:WD40 repeat protein
MNAQEALSLVEAVLNQNRLSQLQKTVFCHAWEEQSYLEIARRSGYELGYVKQTGSQLWQLLSHALNEKVTKHNVQDVLKHKMRTEDWGRKTELQTEPVSLAVSESITTHSPLLHPRVSAALSPIESLTPPSIAPPQQATILNPAPRPPKCDWGDAVDVSVFYGRAAELATLEQWIMHDRCRLVGLFGMGGIGKTSLSVKLAKQLTTPANDPQSFEFVIWRSLRNAPPLGDLLADLMRFLSDQQNVALSDTLDGQLRQLMGYLRQHRCLILLDNGETLMGQSDRNSGYLPGYEGYAQLWQWIGETEHQSTVVLTSREKPSGIASREGKTLPVRSLRLTGLSAEVGQVLFNAKGEFVGTEAEWNTLVDHYAGNPLALKMVAPVIQDLFDGQIASFLDCSQTGSLVFGDIQDLLAQQIDRLSSLEHQVMYWLAIVRKPITLSQLRFYLTPTVSLSQLLEALSSLERRFLIDKTKPTLVEKAQVRFTLQPVVMEYLTEQLIDRICQEIAAAAAGRMTNEGGKMNPDHSSISPLPSSPLPSSLFHTHALLLAQTKDYIRETQVRLILQPIANRLLSRHRLSELAALFRQILADWRSRSPQQTGYAAGNLINLLCQLGVDLTGWDFSGLTVWSAYLRGVNLHQVNFTGADLAKSVFTETFSQILTVAFSPDGKLLATGDVNHEIHIWQVADGKQLLSCKLDEGWVWSVAFSPNGQWLASSANRTVKLWDVQTGTCLQTFRGYTDRVFSVAFSPDGRLLATGSEDHLIRIWDLRTGTLLHTLAGHTHEVRSVAFSPIEVSLPTSKPGLPATATAPNSKIQVPKSNLLASASFDSTIRLWDALTGQCLGRLSGHTGWVWSVAFSPDGRLLASSSDDRTLRLWDVSAVETLRQGPDLYAQPYSQVLIGHTQPVRTVAFNADGRTLASGSDDRTLRLWDYRTGDCLGMLSGHSSWISSVSFSPENHWLASGSEDQSVRLWDSRSRLCIKTLQGYSNGVWSVAFDAQGPLLASGSQDRSIRLWDHRTGTLVGTLNGHSSWIWSVVFSPTDAVLASSSEDRSIKLWDTHSHTLLRTLEEHQDAVLSLLFSPDGRTLFSGSLDGTLKYWEAQTGYCRRTLTGHTGGVWCIALSTEGQYLISGSQDQTVKVWQVSSGRCLHTLTGHEGWIRSVAISPPRSPQSSSPRYTIASGSADGVIHLWSLEQGTCLHTRLAHSGPVLSLAFHPNGQTFASCGTDGLIKIWDTSNCQCVQTLSGHDRWVRFLCYHPDGQTLASCSQDETIKLWQVPTGIPPVPDSSTGPSMTLRIPRPYEAMTIAQVTSLTPAQIATLKMLGAKD